jgi:hypothetical protein
MKVTSPSFVVTFRLSLPRFRRTKSNAANDRIILATTESCVGNRTEAASEHEGDKGAAESLGAATGMGGNENIMRSHQLFRRMRAMAQEGLAER